MANEELLTKLRQARQECGELEARLSERARREADELAELTETLVTAQREGRTLEVEEAATVTRFLALDSERDALRPGLWGWRLYRARLVEPALQAGLFFGCFFVWAWGKGHGQGSPSLGIAAGVLLAAVVLVIQRRGSARGQ